MICVELARGSATLLEGEIEQIQFLLGHVSIQTTERLRNCLFKVGCILAVVTWLPAIHAIVQRTIVEGASW
jgi:hypothetical protein